MSETKVCVTCGVGEPSGVAVTECRSEHHANPRQYLGWTAHRSRAKGLTFAAKCAAEWRAHVVVQPSPEYGWNVYRVPAQPHPPVTEAEGVAGT